MPDIYSSINAASGVKTEKTPTIQKNTANSMNQEQFLRLFVTQLQNQDPLNPQDATEMSSQLAQYSQLEQLTNLNAGMTSLVESNMNSDRLSSLSTIGKNVAYVSDTIDYQGEPVEIGYSLENAVSDVSITVKKNNAVVATLQGDKLGKGNHYLSWDGTNNTGVSLPPGEYSFSVQATDSTGKTTQLTPLIRSEATGVDLTGAKGGTILTKSGEVAFDEILGVFD